MRNLIIGCLTVVVLVLIAVLIFFVLRVRQEPQAQQQPSAQPAGESQPTINITWPSTGARVRVGRQFQVHAVAMDPRGIYSIGFAVDGQAGNPVTAAPPLTTFSTAIPITLQTRGVHTIAVQANSTTGVKSEPAAIKVVAVQSLSDAPSAGDPPTPVPEVPSGQPPPPPPDQPPPPPAPSGASVNFVANPTSIQQGQCSTLRWDVEGVREIYFEGVGVTGHEQRQQCPTRTTTYTLHVVFQDASARDYTATVTVSGGVVAPPPPQPPAGGGQPDLVVTGNLPQAVQGQPFTARVTVTNQGTGDAGAFTVRWHFHAVTGLADCNWDVPGLRAGQEWSASCTRTTTSRPGDSPTELTVDVEQEIPESNEGNNEATPMLTVGTADQEGTTAVTNATVGVNHTTYNGPCPNTFTANARITANGAGTVKYRWERSDGTNSETRTLQFDAAGEKGVTNFDWQIPSSGNYWLRVHVLEPNDLVSNRGETAWNCTGQQAPAVPAAPSNLQALGRGGGQIVVRWQDNSNNEDGFEVQRVLPDGGVGAVAYVGANAAQVAVDLPPCGISWKYQVRARNSAGYSQPSNIVSVQGDPCPTPTPTPKPLMATVTLVSVSTSPTAFTGSCPHTFHFTGVIRTSGPGTVTYRWERSDGNSDTRTLQFSAAGDKTIESGDFKSGSSGTFWARLHVLTPNDKVSNQATFTLTCK